MSFNSKTARKQAGKQPCVVIDRDPDGNDFVYADSGVVDFGRSAHIRENPMYRYTPLPIPDGSLNQPASFLADGSEAERRVRIIAGALEGLKKRVRVRFRSLCSQRHLA